MGRQPRSGDIPWLSAHSILNWIGGDTSMLDLFTAKSRTMCRNLRRVSSFASCNGLKPLFPLACGGLTEQQCVPRAAWFQKPAGDRSGARSPLAGFGKVTASQEASRVDIKLNGTLDLTVFRALISPVYNSGRIQHPWMKRFTN